jgi:hypothetical protein
MPWDYKIGYAAIPGKMCSSGLTDEASGEAIEVAFLDALVDGVPLSAYQCSAAAAATAADGSTKTLDKSGKLGTDTVTVFSVCGTLDILKKACDAAEGCKGFHKVEGKNRGFLLKDNCQREALAGLADSPIAAGLAGSYTYYAKMDPESAGGEGCPMGMAVLAYGLEDLTLECPELDDKEQYNPVEGTDSKFGTGCAEISWSDNGCGWLVQSPSPDPPDTGADLGDCDYMTCSNRVPEANWIFGFEGGEYDPEICMRTEPWLKMGYCQNDLWKALCPEMCSDVTCDICKEWMNDNTAAAAVLASMIGLDSLSTPCESLADGNMCEDPVVKAVCVATCTPTERRLSAEETEAHLAATRKVYSPLFRESLSTIEEMAKELLAPEGRRLAWYTSSPMVSLYGSWDPTSTRPAACTDLTKSAVAPPDYTLLDTAPLWWDWWSWRTTKHGLNIMPDCPDQPTYLTASNKYCDTNNMIIMDIPVGDMGITEATFKEITDDLCWKKCATTDDDGNLAEFCDGFDPAFNKYSNALCVPRSTCEKYCDDVGAACVGFEIHKEVPRCYLITDVCMDAVPSTKYDQVTKGFDKVRYFTNYDMSCTIGGSVISSMTGVREECEAACNANMDCGGFDYTPSTATCELHSIDRTDFKPAQYCSGGGMMFASTTATTDTLTATDGTYYVEKMMNGVSVESPWSPPCKAVVSAPPESELLPGTALGAYTRTLATDCGAPAQDVVCYMSPSAAHRLVWGGQTKGPGGTMMYLEGTAPISRQCSGWVLEALGPAGEFEPVYATYLGEGVYCPTEPTTFSLNAPDGYVGMYSWKPMIDYSVSMNFVCKSYPMCGTLQTCVLAKQRFYSELDIQLSTGSTMAPRYDFVPTGMESLLDPVTFRPKTLISVEMAVLFVAKVKAQYGAELYRNVPGPLRIKIADLGAGVSSAIIRMVSAAGTTLFGKSYTVPSGYKPWYTDVCESKCSIPQAVWTGRAR